MKPQFHGDFITTYCGLELLHTQYIVFVNLYIVVMEQLGTCLATTQLLRLKYRINYICSQHNKSIWLIQVEFIPFMYSKRESIGQWAWVSSVELKTSKMLYKISQLNTYLRFENYVVLHGSKPKRKCTSFFQRFKNYVVLRRYGIAIINK